MKLWLDDLRTPPQGWVWVKTVPEAIAQLSTGNVTHLSLDHDLGGEGMGSEETSRPLVLWLCEQEQALWPPDIVIHSWNPIGAEWLKGMCERYSPWQDFVPYRPSEQHWSGEEPVNDYSGGWFGPTWGAPVCDPARHKPTPVDDNCVECAQPINDGDRGMLVPFAGMTPAVLGAYHLYCFLRVTCPPGLLEEIDRAVLENRPVFDDDPHDDDGNRLTPVWDGIKGHPYAQ